MKSLVLVYAGRYEDQRICPWVLLYQSDDDLTALEIAHQLKNDLARLSPNPIGVCCETAFQSSNARYCPECGRSRSQYDFVRFNDYSIQTFREILSGTCDSIGNVVEELDELGWDSWHRNGFRDIDQVVTLINFDAFLEDEKEYTEDASFCRSETIR
jgi:hypothetical protein